MNRAEFDSLTRSLGVDRSRRGLSRLLGTLVLGGALAGPLGHTQAKKGKSKNGGKKSKKHRKCKPHCAGKVCGNDGCGGSCGACSTGRICLSNGSCAQNCTANTDCPAGCACSLPSLDGPQHCTFPVLCADVSQECSRTAECPPGNHCQTSTCNGNRNFCVPLCPV